MPHLRKEEKMLLDSGRNPFVRANTYNMPRRSHHKHGEGDCNSIGAQNLRRARGAFSKKDHFRLSTSKKSSRKLL
jgi:hypothetical protein